MNLVLFRMINSMAYKSSFLDFIMIFYSTVVPYIYILFLSICFIRGVVKKDRVLRGNIVATGVFTAMCMAINFIIGNVYFVKRPFVDHEVNLLVKHAPDASFPSDHSAGTMAIALESRFRRRIIKTVLIINALLVGFSRIYVGNHYPADVLGAFAIVYFSRKIFDKYLRLHILNYYNTFEKILFKEKLRKAGSER